MKKAIFILSMFVVSDLSAQSVGISANPAEGVCVDGAVTFTADPLSDEQAEDGWSYRWKIGTDVVTEDKEGNAADQVSLELVMDEAGQHTITVEYLDENDQVKNSGTLQYDVVSVAVGAYQPHEICADGTTTVSLSSSSITPPSRTLTYTILHGPIPGTDAVNDNLGCTIDASTGDVTAGTQNGTIMVQAEDSAIEECYQLASLFLVRLGEAYIDHASLCVDSTSTAAATVPYYSGSDENLTWSIEGDALGGSIDPATGVISAGDTVGTITVRATASIDDGRDSCTAEETIQFTDCSSDDDDYTLDIEIYDYGTDGQLAAVAEDAEDTDTGGAVITLNDDDDNDNGTKDWQEDGAITEEDDLQKIIIKVTGTVPNDSTSSLTFPDAVGIYNDQARTTAMSSGGTISSSELPLTLWVEGRTVSTSANEVSITVSDGDAHQDTVKLTVERCSYVVQDDGSTDPSLVVAPAVLTPEFIDLAIMSMNYDSYIPDGILADSKGDSDGPEASDIQSALAPYGFSVEVENARTPDDTIAVEISSSDGSVTEVQLSRVTGTNVFRPDADAAQMLCVATENPDSVDSSSWGHTALFDSTGGTFDSRAKTSKRKGPKYKVKKNTIKYFPIQNKEVNGGIINPPYIVRGQPATFGVNRSSQREGSIVWEMTNSRATVQEANNNGEFTGNPAVLTAGNTDGDVAVRVRLRRFGEDECTLRVEPIAKVCSLLTVPVQIVYCTTTALSEEEKATQRTSLMAQFDLANMLWKQAGVEFSLVGAGIVFRSGISLGTLDLGEKEDLKLDFSEELATSLVAFYATDFAVWKAGVDPHGEAEPMTLEVDGDPRDTAAIWMKIGDCNDVKSTLAHEYGHALGTTTHTGSPWMLMTSKMSKAKLNRRADIGDAVADAARGKASTSGFVGNQ